MKSSSRYIIGMLLATSVSGCAHIVSNEQRSLDSHVEFMKRAGEADRQTWMEMKQEAEKLANGNRVHARLKLGMLLTTPGSNEADVQAGAGILVDLLENAVRLNPYLRDLIHVRLQELNARRRLEEELRGAEGKIDDLLSIEKKMEADKENAETKR